MKVYGIPNCDIIKKTTEWLKKQQLDFNFHDYKKEGISKEKLKEWFSKVDWQTILNKRSTTWRELPLDVQENIKTEKDAIQLLIENTSIIKRPIIEKGNKILVGFNETEFIKQLK